MCKRSFLLIGIGLFLLAMVASGATAAEITQTKDSSLFDVKWECDTNFPPNHEIQYGDLDSGAYGSDGDIWTMIWNYDGNDYTQFVANDWDNPGYVSAATGWSVEFRLKFPDTPSNPPDDVNGRFQFGVTDGTDGQIPKFLDHSIMIYPNIEVANDINLADGAFHIYRLAKAADSNVFKLYVDDKEIYSLPRSDIIDTFEEGRNSFSNHFWWGDASGGIDGTIQMDYLRWSPGGYRAPTNKAWEPLPVEGQDFVPLASVLTWIAGDNAASHNVYIGTVEADVIAGTGGTFKINQAGTTYPAAGGLGLDPGEIYYWRIDEVNGSTTWTGDMWSFVSWPAEATSPSPEDGNNLVDLDETVLTWAAGGSAASHDVYIGTDIDDVIAGSGGTSKGNQAGLTYPSSGDLDLMLGTTYYWRIDEVNGATTWTGDIWSFSVPNYLVVDDMESYDSGNPIYNIWVDGYVNYSGSWIDISTTYVHYVKRRGEVIFGSTKSMDFAYDNRASYGGYSEGSIPMSRLSTIGANWAGEGIEALSIWFAGLPDNDANETMYVSIKDGDGPLGNFEVRYGDNVGEDMNHITDGDWHEWNIDLNPFVTAGVNLNNVESLHIGFDDSDKLNRGSTAGGSGTVYFDDIRVYIPRCLPEHSPDGDISGPLGELDCLVDEWDVKKMAEQWLFAPTGATGTVAWWKLDEDSGDTAADSSGFGNDGTLGKDPNAPTWVIDSNATRGNCLEFNGWDNWIVVDDQGGNAEFEFYDEDFSMTFWVKAANDINGCVFFLNGTATAATGSNKRYEISYEPSGGGYVYFACDDDVDKAQITAVAEPNFLKGGEGDEEWTFVVGVRDTLNDELRLYADCVLQATGEDVAGDISSPGEPLYIGSTYDLYQPGVIWGWFKGKLDDVQVYDRALTEAEIINIYNGIPIEGGWISDLTGDDRVKFDDFAKMADDFGVPTALFP